MEEITASLERSLQNCSLNHHTRRREEEEEEEEAYADAAAGLGISSSSDDVAVVDNHHHISNSSDTSLELNSHLSLPYHWEQCLDLKTGDIYYINWKNGMKAKEDPRSMMGNPKRINEEEAEEEEEEEEESLYDSEESSSESYCPSSSSNNKEYHQHHQNNNINNNVLVVTGCKSCLMYFMVPKQVEDCPKCTGQLLHFDRSLNNNATTPSSSP